MSGNDVMGVHAPGAFRMSDEIGEISAAMASAYASMGTAGKDANNTFFGSRYADMASVDAAIRPALAANDVFVMQTVTRTEALGLTCTTRLMHKSGEWIESDVVYVEPIAYEKVIRDRDGRETGKETVYPSSQSHGSAQTYARRYGLMSAVGLAVSDSTDDDGNAAASHQSGGSGQSQRRSQGRQRSAGGSAQSKPQYDNSKPRQMEARRDGRKPCPICGGKISRGEEIAYHGTEAPVKHWDCYVQESSGALADTGDRSGKDDDLPF